jgi:hypothetical protein
MKRGDKKKGSITFVMGFTFGQLISMKLSGSIWSYQRKALKPLNSVLS